MALANWVGREITYAHDSGEYWKLPRETIADGRGDCEDQAILLCSLLRAAGYDENSAFVIVGTLEQGGESAGHAWVRIFAEKLGIGVWIDLEATSGGINILYELIGLADYQDTYQFNDVNFRRLG